MNVFLQIISIFFGFSIASVSFANATTNATPEDTSLMTSDFSLLTYHTNYLLPMLVSSQHSQLSASNTPDDQPLQPEEISFQLSVKVPLFKNIFNKKNTVYVAYTQLSFWQAYNSSPFFRATDYEPEIFIENNIQKMVDDNWLLDTVNVGAVHQSNGQGGDNERSWNRLYTSANFTHDHWLVNVEPWYVIPDASMHEHNADITSYLGHGQVLTAYQYQQHSFAVTTYGFENGGNRTTGVFTWSFPLSHTFDGYMQVFSGYGQSLLEYDHHINSIGIGIALGNPVDSL